MKLLIASLFAVLGVVSLVTLRRPYSQRSARWGKRGIGPKMSALSIVVLSAWLFALSAAMSASKFMQFVPPDLEIIVVFCGFCAAAVCGITDMIIEAQRKKEEPIPEGSTAPQRAADAN